MRGAWTWLAVLDCLHHGAAVASRFLTYGKCQRPTERTGGGFQEEAGRDGGNISVRLLRVLNKLDLSYTVVWLGYFFHFSRKNSGKEHRAVTILQFLLWAVLEQKDVEGLGIEKVWGKQICPVLCLESAM